MASWMMHLRIADELIDSVVVNNKTAFNQTTD